MVTPFVHLCIIYRTYCLSFDWHIFEKAQVASNKNAHRLQHHFWAQFFMLFHMMWSILFRVLALKTLKWKFLIGCWRTSTKEKVVSRPNTLNKMNHTMWKSVKNCAPKWCCKLCAFLFKVTCPFWKMCLNEKHNSLVYDECKTQSAKVLPCHENRFDNSDNSDSILPNNSDNTPKVPQKPVALGQNLCVSF